MQWRTTFLMVLASLLLAGCVGSLPGGTSGPTLDDVTYPPGVTDDGVNGTMLVDAHTDALENRSFTTRTHLDERKGDESDSATMTALIGPDRDRIAATVASTDGERSAYLTEDTEYIRIVKDGQTTYRVTSRTPEALSLAPVSYANERYLTQILEMANFTPSEARLLNGTTVVVLTANTSDVEGMDGLDVTSFEGTLLVDEEGVIRSANVKIAGESTDGTTIEREFSMTLTDVGDTTVSEPDWIEDAEDEAGQS